MTGVPWSLTLTDVLVLYRSSGGDASPRFSPAIATPPIIAAFEGPSQLGSIPDGMMAAVAGDQNFMGGFTTGLDSAFAGPGASGSLQVWVFPKEESLLVADTVQQKLLQTWMVQLQAMVTVVCTPNSVDIHVLDFTRGAFYCVPLGATVGGAPEHVPQGALTQDGVSKWQKWCKVVSVTELSDGKLALLQEDGFVRLFEFGEEALELAEADWQVMVGGSGNDEGGRRAQEDGSDGVEEDEWESGVVLRVHGDGAVLDVQLHSGEIIDAVELSALDCDEAGLGKILGFHSHLTAVPLVCERGSDEEILL